MQVPVQVLPEGSTFPPLPYLVVLALGVAGVALALSRVSPAVTDRVVVAFAPWMVVGSSSYVLHQVDGVAALLAPFCSSPRSTSRSRCSPGGLGGERGRRPPCRPLATAVGPGVVAFSGVVLAVVVVGWTLVRSASGGLHPVWRAVGLAVAAVCAVAVWEPSADRCPLPA